MNILSEQQARARQLSLPRDGLLTGVSEEFIVELQQNGTFVEYNLFNFGILLAQKLAAKTPATGATS